jgi:hypothetical protein
LSPYLEPKFPHRKETQSVFLDFGEKWVGFDKILSAIDLEKTFQWKSLGVFLNDTTKSLDLSEFRILYYIQAETAEQPGKVQIFRVGKRNDDEVYKNL